MLERIDRYELRERIGAGGQATVYLGRDTLLERTVAVKVMNQLVSAQPEYVDSLMSEAQLAAGLSHQNIATVYDFKIDGDYACIVMEYFPNSLDKELQRDGAASTTKAVDIAAQICDGLAYAHAMGFVHRDIKPHNILMGTDGSPKITDFGIARATDLSSTNAVGTPLYMSPEQCRGEESPDVRSDIYSIGITLYEILAGAPPYQGSAMQLTQMHLNDPVPDFPSSVHVPANLAAIVRKCMEKDPGDRYQNAQEVASALRALSDSPSRVASGAAAMGQQDLSDPGEPEPTGRDWRRQGRYTVLGEVGKDDRQGFRRNVQAGADEVVIIRKNGEIEDVYSEQRKPTRFFGESLMSLVGLGPNIEVYKATKTRFNIVFWLGDDHTAATGHKSFAFGLPVLTSDNQVIPARINLWIEVDEELAENTLLLLRGKNVLNRYDIASEIRDDLHAKVLGLDLNQHTFEELRGNRPLLREVGESIQREISGTLGAFGLRIQDYSISWGLTLQERADIDQQKHQVSLEQVRNLNEIGRISITPEQPQQGLGGAVEVILRPSIWARAIAVMSLIAAIIFFTINASRVMEQARGFLGLSTGAVAESPIPQLVVPTVVLQEDVEAIPIESKADGAYKAIMPLADSADLFQISRVDFEVYIPPDSSLYVETIPVNAAPVPPAKALFVRVVDINIEGPNDTTYLRATVEFHVKTEWLEDQSVSFDDVQLFRHQGEWTYLETEHLGSIVGSGNEFYERFSAETPGFSVFALGIRYDQAVSESVPTMEVPLTATQITAPTATTTVRAAASAVLGVPTAIANPTATPKPKPTPARVKTFPVPTPTPVTISTPTPVPLATATPVPNKESVVSVPELKVSGETFRAGDKITVTYTGMAGKKDGWIGMFNSGDPDTSFKGYKKIGSEGAGFIEFVAPKQTGTYEFRLMSTVASSPYNREAASGRINVLPAFTPTQIATAIPTPTPSTTVTLTPTPDPSGDVDGGRLDNNEPANGSINYVGDYDEWNFNGTAGIGLTVSVSPSEGSDIDVYVELINSSGNLETQSGGAGGSTNAIIYGWILQQGGQYTVRVSSASGTGGYTIEVGVITAAEVNLPKVSIPDANLMRVIQEALNIAPGDPITESDLAGLTELSARDAGIVNISGLQYAVNLKELDLGVNGLEDISALQGLTNLVDLTLQANNVSDISTLESLVRMEMLDIRQNNISDISPLSSMSDLFLLLLSYNQVTDISALSSLDSLSSMDLISSGTYQVTDISSLAGLENLARLDIRGNAVSDISALKYLNYPYLLLLSDNDIDDISPLVNNDTIDGNTTIWLGDNALELWEGSDDLEDVETLQARGVDIAELDTIIGNSDSELILLAKFEFNGSPDNSVIGGPSISLTNTSYENQVLRTSGSYYNPSGGGVHPEVSVSIPDFNFEAFSMEVDFLIEAETEISLGYFPIIVGGRGHRWFSIYLNSDEELGISLNNQDYSIPSNFKVARNTWYNVTGTFDLDNRKVELYLGTDRIIDHTLSSDFALDVITGNPDDKTIALTNFSNATAFNGLVDNLSIWSGIISGSSPAASSSSSIVIPDIQLAEALRTALNKSIQDDITANDMASLIYLDVVSENIEGISGLEHAVNLIELRVSQNQISDLSPLEDLENLEVLYFYGNDVSDISPLRNLTELNFINAGDNQISDLSALEILTGLRTLWLNGNQISIISPLANLTNLDYLRLEENSISEISALSLLTKVENLWLHSNQINELAPLRSMSALTELHLQNNEVTDIDPLVWSQGEGRPESLLFIDLRGNKLDLTQDSPDMLNMEELRSRGVEVITDPPVVTATQTWEPGPSLDTSRYGLATVSYEGKVYAIGGWNGPTIMEVFDPSTESWITLSPLPSGQSGLAASQVDGYIYTFGSYGWEETVQVYDIDKDQWSSGPGLPRGMYWGTAETIGDNIYVIGGHSSIGPLSTVYILDTTTLTWSQGSDMPAPAQVPASAVYEGEIYIFPLNHKYNPETDSWTPFTGAASGHGYASGAVTAENEIYLIGGSPGSIYQAYETTEIYDPLNDSWRTVEDLDIGRYQFGAVYLDGKIYSIGGRNGEAGAEDSVEVLIVSP
ncbi:protein kinase [Dehalococcoidia bacterium]|nr:protein kinase [Dehalococcoidia bacterium]